MIISIVLIIVDDCFFYSVPSNETFIGIWYIIIKIFFYYRSDSHKILKYNILQL